ncbi:chloride channel protein [Flavimaricola marinus]|uniref:H(+)/Cl(-) exchange transporter ClcA n=1 Tax=Flavimaricola marinus TaxID=1819565 RepID=A0A238LFR4_9RHOB|nr:chloride channel protein [Flavimaricola marinus]SMY07730.1 H(+)/Cl(-) exchange transporter ClcA [Flavimaricola marinus]
MIEPAEKQTKARPTAFASAVNGIARGWEVLRTRGPSEVQFWFIALLVGIASGLAAIAFRFGIENLQAWIYGTDNVLQLHSHIAGLDWWWIFLIPVGGGLAVGLLLDRFTDDGRVRAVAEVIEAAALNNGRVQRRRGLVSSLASLITLSTGGSSGREGPVVHLAAVLSSYVAGWIRADGIHGRDLLGCAVAAAVSASFNAPIAGALFALEVVLRHFAVHAFAPIAIASVAGTIINRLVYGDVTEFVLPMQSALEFYVELPAFMMLGLLSGIMGVVLMRSIFWADDIANGWQTATGLPRWARPAVAGAMLGALAIWWPHIIGVGYETTSLALTGDLVLREAVVFIVLKVAAVAITMGGRMGGGVFSPSLMVGALTGLAFGLVATSVFPEVSGEQSLYALAGMGAVAAAVLGAPISTTLIVFELTGDWQTGLAVMVTVSLSSALASRMVDRSFFLTQLERRGVHLAAGPEAWLLGTFDVQSIMRSPDHPRGAKAEACQELVLAGTWLDKSATLEEAMPLFEKTNAAFLPVVHFPGDDAPPEVWGALFQVDALKALNRALVSTAVEEHS